MRRDAFDETGEELAEEIVEEIPATPTEIAAELPDDVETFVEETPELPDDSEAFKENLPCELTNEVENANETIDYLSVLLPDKLAKELD